MLFLQPLTDCKGNRRTIRRIREEENNKQDGEVVSEDRGEEEDERKERRTVRGGVKEEGSPRKTWGKDEKAESARGVEKDI